jgi:hypothetical protein
MGEFANPLDAAAAAAPQRPSDDNAAMDKGVSGLK